MNVLLIGGGGREHALAWALHKSPQLDTLYCAPGNPGMAALGSCTSLDASDHDAVIAFCKEKQISLVVVGPEAPLVAGLGDDLAEAGIACFGPSRYASQLEGSKAFTKELCDEMTIPTARYGCFDNATDAKGYIAAQSTPIVVKADGLAAGKGVVIAQTRGEAEAAIDACFEGAFGAAGREIVIEEFLEGEEASFFALVDGRTALPLASAQDHKRVGDGDTGPNTGGMGAYSPAPVMTDELNQIVMQKIINPTVVGLNKRGHPFKGILYAGLMVTAEGPKLIEYNVRFGDPECQVLMMRLKSDLLSALVATTNETLSNITLDWHDDTALSVVMAADGYPGTPEKGSVIEGISEASQPATVEVFHAGTKQDGDRIVANGGRVLNVTARGATVGQARERAYAAVNKIKWPQGFCRSDIGWRAIAREKAEN